MAAVIQRPLRGSRISTFYPVKNLPSLASLDSAFQLQEYISLLIRLDVHDVDAIISLPGTSSKDKDHSVDKQKENQGESAKDGERDLEKGKNEVSVDEACWIYEQLRRLAQDLSHPLITTLQQECTRASCPEMKAGEWLYLCVAHGNDGAMEQCCAIDYILHTVDSATALLNSPRTFPSRLSIPQTSHRHFSSLARRLGRIFAHAYFHHREAFEQAEVESSLYARFLALTAKFDLVPAEFLVIPSNQSTSGESSPPGRDRDFPPHGFYENRRYPPRHVQEAHGTNTGNTNLPMGLAQKYMQHQQLGLDGRTPSPNPPGLDVSSGSGSGSESKNGGIGEMPSAASRPRFGRNRTDTMVFSDAEASAVADELAAKARAGELETDYEHEGPKTAKPTKEEGESGAGKEGENDKDKDKETSEDNDEPDLENETQFEISLSPEGDISFADIATIPTDVVGDEQVEEQPAETETVTEEPPEKEKPETITEAEPAPAPDTATPPVEEEQKVDEEKTVELEPSEETQVPEAAVEPPVAEAEPVSAHPPPTSTTPPLPDEPKEVPSEAEPAPEEAPPPPAEKAEIPEVVEPLSSSTATPSSEPSSSEAPSSAPDPTPEVSPASVEPPEPDFDSTIFDESFIDVEAIAAELTTPEESASAVAAEPEQDATSSESVKPAPSVEAEKVEETQEKKEEDVISSATVPAEGEVAPAAGAAAEKEPEAVDPTAVTPEAP